MTQRFVGKRIYVYVCVQGCVSDVCGLGWGFLVLGNLLLQGKLIFGSLRYVFFFYIIHFNWIDIWYIRFDDKDTR